MLAHNLLSLNNVSFTYPGGLPVFQDVNLEIKSNELLIVKGTSGAGKSTFLKLFNRFCDSRSGEILLREKELHQYNIEQLRSSIIYLPQLPVMIDGTVEDNLAFPFQFGSHKNKKYDPVKAAEWVEYFQLNVPMNQDSLKLSIGQKQRIALIRSMLLEPEVLLLDEPGSALDNNNRRLIEQKIEHLMDTSRVTVIMATHGEVSFTDTAVRVYCLEDKKLALLS